MNFGTWWDMIFGLMIMEDIKANIFLKCVNQSLIFFISRKESKNICKIRGQSHCSMWLIKSSPKGVKSCLKEPMGLLYKGITNIILVVFTFSCERVFE
jgi:hypothetical protein